MTIVSHFFIRHNFPRTAMSRVPEKERAQYQAYIDQGWSISAIARYFNRKRDTVRRWVKEERKDLKDIKGQRGRKRKTTPREDKKIVERYQRKWRKRTGRRGISRDLQKKPAGIPQISGQTVYKRLKEAGGKMKTIQKRFPLTDEHKRKRVKFAKVMKFEDFGKWLFSDETKFEIGTRKRKAFEFSGE